MLTLTVQNDQQQLELKFEHSLLSLSKWEARTKKPWLSRDPKSPGQLMDYFQDMLLPPEDDPDLVFLLKPEQMEALVNYIGDSQTASSVPDDGKKEFNPEVITSELIYYWMVAMKIPFQPAETWHLNRLMMLIQITNFKNQPPKKRSASDVMADWYAKNKEQKKRLGIED